MTLNTTLHFADALTLQAGTTLSEFDTSRPHTITSGELRAVQDCAGRVQVATGRRPVVVHIGGKLRVVERRLVA